MEDPYQILLPILLTNHDHRGKAIYHLNDKY